MGIYTLLNAYTHLRHIKLTRHDVDIACVLDKETNGQILKLRGKKSRRNKNKGQMCACHAGKKKQRGKRGLILFPIKCSFIACEHLKIDNGHNKRAVK